MRVYSARWLAGIFSIFAPAMAAAASGSADGKWDGTWAGTYGCSEGVGTVAGIKPFSHPITFTVAGRLAVLKTDNANFAEQATLAFDEKGRATVELIGERKADPAKNWRVKAVGPATGDSARAEGPMYRKDGTTLIRQYCVYDLHKQPLSGAPVVAPTPAAPPPVASAPAAPPPVAPNPASRPDDAQKRAAAEQARQRKASEDENQRLQAEAAAAKQKAEEAEQRAAALAQQLAATQAAATGQATADQQRTDAERQQQQAEAEAAKQKADEAEQRAATLAQQLAAVQAAATRQATADQQRTDAERQQQQAEAAAAKQKAEEAEQRAAALAQQLAAVQAARQTAEPPDADQQSAEAERQQQQAEIAAAKQKAEEAEQRAAALAKQLAAVQAKAAEDARRPLPTAAPAPAPAAGNPAVDAPAAGKPPADAPPAAKPPVDAAPAGKPPVDAPAAGKSSADAAAAVKAPAAAARTSPPEDPATLLYQGTDDEKRLQDLMAALVAKDTGRNAPRNEEEAKKSAAEDAATTLAVLNSLDALGLNIFLDTSSPLLHRALSGDTTLGDGKSPIHVLLLDAMTRIPRRTLLQSAALSLGLATDPTKASTDTTVYLQTLGTILGKALKDKGIEPAAPKAGGDARFTIEFAPEDWAENGGGAFDYMGPGSPIVIAFDAQFAPVRGTDVVMYLQSSAAWENTKQLKAYEQLILRLKARLQEAHYESIATPSLADLAAVRIAQLQAMKQQSDRATEEMLARIARIDDAVAQNTPLVGALRIYRKGKGLTAKPADVFCTVSAKDGIMLKGFAASPAFLGWAQMPTGSRFSQVLDTPDALYAAIGTDKCGIVVDQAANLKRYMAAIGRDGQFAFNVGPTMTLDEAREPFATAAGYRNWAEYAFSEAIGGQSPAEMQTLASFGITNDAAYNDAVSRMRAQNYATEAADLPEFLADEAEGKKAGQSAKAYRAAETRRQEAEAKEQDAAERQRLLEQAKEFPYVAILTCGMGNRHINVRACFVAQNAASVDTELKLRNGDDFGLYKAYNIDSVGKEHSDGFYIDLRKHFSLVAQNSHDTLILGLKILDRVTGKVLYQNAGAQFAVLSASN